MQVYEKYMSLARDAASSGDRIGAEGFFQFAEHYYRILNDTTDPQRAGPPQERVRGTPAEPYPVNAEQPMIDRETSAASAKGNGQTPGTTTADGTEPQAAGGPAAQLEAVPTPAASSDDGAPADLPAAPMPEAEAKPETETKPVPEPEAEAEAKPEAEMEAAAPPAETKPRGRGRPRTRAKADNGSGEKKQSKANGSAGSSRCGPSGV